MLKIDKKITITIEGESLTPLAAVCEMALRHLNALTPHFEHDKVHAFIRQITSALK